VLDDDDLIVPVADANKPTRMRQPEQRIMGASLRQQGGNLAIGHGLTSRDRRC